MDELKVEMVCAEGCLREALQALLTAHPYETPAFEYRSINPRLHEPHDTSATRP